VTALAIFQVIIGRTTLS